MSDTPYQGPLLSADSHVVEPRDLWLTRMDVKWRDRAPRIETLEGLGDSMIVEGLKPRPLAFEGPMIEFKARGVEIPKITDFRYEDTRPGGWDPDARLKDQDLDGVSGEVVYPGVGLFVCDTPDADYELAVCQTYNDWLAEFCAAHPTRLKGAALLPGKGPIERIVAEAERAIGKLGLAAVMLPATNTAQAYNQPVWDGLWARLEQMGVMCTFHLGGTTFPAHIRGPGASGALVCGGKFQQLAEPLNLVIWGGAPIRFPRMKWSLVEGGIGWIAAVLDLMDHWWNDHKGWMKPRLEETPSTYFRRNFFATFEDDRAGVRTRDIIGVDNIMWGSDYPHTEGVWPFSRRQVGRDFVGCPADETRKMVYENVAKVFGFPIAA